MWNVKEREESRRQSARITDAEAGTHGGGGVEGSSPISIFSGKKMQSHDLGARMGKS